MERRLKPRLVLLLVLAYVGAFAARHTARPQIARPPLLALRGGAKPYTRETAALLAWKLRTAKEPKAPPPRFCAAVTKAGDREGSAVGLN